MAGRSISKPATPDAPRGGEQERLKKPGVRAKLSHAWRRTVQWSAQAWHFSVLVTCLAGLWFAYTVFQHLLAGALAEPGAGALWWWGGLALTGFAALWCLYETGMRVRALFALSTQMDAERED